MVITDKHAAIIGEQVRFSIKTFGHGDRTVGVAKHILSEIVEVKANPKDIFEWADIMILALDGMWRREWYVEWGMENEVEGPDQDFMGEMFRRLFGETDTLLAYFDDLDYWFEGNNQPLNMIEFVATQYRDFGTEVHPTRWVDIFNEAVRGAQLAGFTACEIMCAFVSKMALNKERAWPAPTSSDQPVFHLAKEETV